LGIGAFSALVAACAPSSAAKPPPATAFYFPSGILYHELTPGDGYLYVASANYDKRFDTGSISAVRLSSVPGLPPIGAEVPASGPVQLENLGSDFKQVYIESFAGEMDAYVPQDDAGQPISGRPIRLFVPTRAEGDLLEIVDAMGTSLTCLHGGTNCIDASLSLTAFERVGDGKPRAPEPIGVAVSSKGDGEVMVTHLKAADSPPKTNQLLETYVVDLVAANPVIDATRFISLGLIQNAAGPSTSSVALGKRYAYLTARYSSTTGTLLFALDSQTKTLFSLFLEATYQTLESRGVAIGKGEQRIYVAGRSPDSLVSIAVVGDPAADLPSLRVDRALTVPDGPNEVAIIPRNSRGDLAVVTSSTAGAVSIYDEDVGRLVAQVAAVGSEPFGIAVQRAAGQARIFVSNFGDGRVAVIDIPDLLHPERARVVAHLGKAQTCLLEGNDASCLGATAP
jgi:hypothetical protein